jgi:hypothetical protein
MKTKDSTNMPPRYKEIEIKLRGTAPLIMYHMREGCTFPRPVKKKSNNHSD